MKPLLQLCLMVKNEAESIRAVLESVRGVIDRAIVLDTGSTDGTQDIVRSVAERMEVFLFEEPICTFEDTGIIDFAATRNRVLDLAGNYSEFTFMMSGDETLSGGKVFREFLESKRQEKDGAYCVLVQTGALLFQSTRVLRAGSAWRYEEPIHEIPVGPEGAMSGPLINEVLIHHDSTDRTKHFKRMREVDRPLLEKIVSKKPQTHKEHVSQGRALMNLGTTHEFIADEFPNEPWSPWLTHKLTAMSYFRRRSDIGGDPDEIHYSLFHYLNIAAIIKLYSDPELVSRLEVLCELDPRRPENRYMLAYHTMFFDPKRALAFAEKAIQVTREAKERPLHMPFDARTEWLSYRVAAECAKQLKQPKRMQAMAEAGIAVGGPKEAFADYSVT